MFQRELFIFWVSGWTFETCEGGIVNTGAVHVTFLLEQCANRNWDKDNSDQTLWWVNICRKKAIGQESCLPRCQHRRGTGWPIVSCWAPHCHLNKTRAKICILYQDETSPIMHDFSWGPTIYSMSQTTPLDIPTYFTRYPDSIYSWYQHWFNVASLGLRPGRRL